MNLIKIGSSYINLDNVTGIYTVIGSSTLRIYFLDGKSIEFEKPEEEKALRQWLNRVATDLTSPEATDEEFAEYQRRGGTLAYPVWQEKHNQCIANVNRPGSWWEKEENSRRAMALEAELLH